MSAINKNLRNRTRERLEAREPVVGRTTSRRPGSAIVSVELDDETESWKKRKVLMGLILLPICMVALVTFTELFFRATVKGAFWRTEGFWFFAFGCLFWLSLGLAKIQPAVLYVFAHEMTHAITARLSGGKIHGMHVSETGGYVETDKTNTFITLSPYLVPFYTVVVFALYGLLCLFTDMQAKISVDILGWTLLWKWAWIFYWFVGATWCFHITFTLEVLRTEQSDLRLNGEFFSMMLIFLANLAIVGAFFILASPTVGVADVWRDASKMVMSVWHWMR